MKNKLKKLCDWLLEAEDEDIEECDDNLLMIALLGLIATIISLLCKLYLLGFFIGSASILFIAGVEYGLITIVDDDEYEENDWGDDKDE